MDNPAATKQLIQSSLIALLAGLVFSHLLYWFWAYFPNLNPFFDWLFECCAAASWFRGVIWVHDIAVNLLLTLPIALFLLKLQPKHPWWYCVLAIIPNFVWDYHHLFISLDIFDPNFLPGIAMQLLILPVALLLVMQLQRRVSSR